jgi:hypothetical protein
MKPDTYTKVVLTVIAGCLLWLCAMNTGRPLGAQQNLQLGAGTAQPVVIVGWGTIDDKGTASVTMDRTGRRSDPNLLVKLVSQPVDVKLVGVPAAPIDVRLNYTDLAPLPVGVTRIKPAGDWEPIRQRAEPEPTRPRPGGH